MSGKKKLWPWNGKEYTIDELCKLAGISKRQFYRRLSKGLSIDEIINYEYVPHYKHRISDTRLYDIYYNMMTRCYNPKHNRYKDYHDRGIDVCDEWRNDNTTFFEWSMNNGYADNLTIDRIDNNKGYSPDNCRWTTTSEQNYNTRRNFLLEYQPDEWLTVAEIAQIENISYKTAYSRYVRNEKTKLPRKYLYKEDK